MEMERERRKLGLLRIEVLGFGLVCISQLERDESYPSSPPRLPSCEYILIDPIPQL
jgi:hypothetical protein